MNIFDLRQKLIGDYSSYIQSFIQIGNPRIQQYVQQELFEQGALWPEPLIQLNPMFEPGCSVDELVAEGLLHPACSQIFRRGKEEQTPQGYELLLHRHQEEAIRSAREGQSYVLTTGTGSGKSLSYIIPIVDYVLRHPRKPGIKAIVVYPMNALANSQLGELKKYLELNYPAHERPVTFRRYTGQEKTAERDEIIADPPDILLTNYVMLELILTRVREQPLLDATRLRFLVLDELHTYRGRQGADVALLVRRVRDRLTPAGETLQCVGTSATLAGGGTYDEQREDVAKMASRIFGCEVLPQHVIGETLRRVTDEVDETESEFITGLTACVRQYEQYEPRSYDEFTRDPLAIWLESTFGVTREDGRLVRTIPRRISGEVGSAASWLHITTSTSVELCIEAIKRRLLAGYASVQHPQTGRAPFAFRLHQFISKGDTVYSTLEHDPQRHITLQYQQFAPGGRERILLPLVFCRECGQEYYMVRGRDEGSFIWRELQDQLHDDDDEKKKEQPRTNKPGFLYIPQGSNDRWLTTDGRLLDSDEIQTLVPDEWKEQRNGRERLTTFGRKNSPQPLRVRTDGSIVEHGAGGVEGVACYFVPAPFRFCLHCGVSYSSYLDNDFEKLTQLSSEGRSTATTILSLSTIRHLKEARERGEEVSIKPKMLSFTDNRQDASLQAGHFNDFVEIGLLRSALYCATQRAGEAGLRYDSLTQRVFEALNLPAKKYAVNEELKYSAKIKTEQALRNVLGYRLYHDLRRGWRITAPNLEQCGLLRIEYQDLQEVCEDEELWQSYKKKPDIKVDCHELLRSMPAELRMALCRTLLDYMRRELAIKVDYLDPSRQDEIKQQSSQHLIAPWGIDEDEKMSYATRLFPRSRSGEDDRGERYLSGLSSYGRYVRRVLRSLEPELKAEGTEKIIRDLLKVLSKAGLVEEVVEARNEKDVPGYQLPASAIIWRAGDGRRGYHDPLHTPNLSHQEEKRVNPFFVDFYQGNAAELGRIQDIFAAEHTAQVPADRREEREKEFRHDRLPILYCSPTMELGVDIAELNVVNMRNIPPTPANYAQRSGRAGRSGQPALVFSYCSTGSSHDQYFFQRPGDMVSGAVKPPRLDLTNEDLIRAHVYAIWLAEAGLSLGESLRDLLDIAGNQPTLALQEHVRAALRDPGARQRATVRASRMLNSLPDELDEKRAPWYSPSWLASVLENVERSFEDACERWRGLYRAAQAQRDTQHAVIQDASRPEKDKKMARQLRSEAEVQLELLTASSTTERTEFSEFYSYRYFASEGFLPGYNFPRLPLSAYIPARRSRQRDEYLSRPRFLAISEFAPRAIVYHEGSRYVINRALLSVRDDHSGVLTTSVKQCDNCGYLYPVTGENSLDVCQHCSTPLPQPLRSLFRLQNVSTRRRDKISSDEEERMRKGYEIRTGVRFPARRDDARPSHFVAFVRDELSDGQAIAKLTYGQAATLWRINFGPVRRKDKRVQGFVLDTERGYWGKEDDAADDPNMPDELSGKNLRVIPYVEDTRNCLLFEPLVALNERQMASLQAALKTAIQACYQLEDNELAAEPLPDAMNRRIVLLYEATEGGAGVLRQLIDDPKAIAEVARQALALCHFDPETGADLGRAVLAREECVAACYYCLMTYANQREHLLLDRRSIRDYLLHLTDCRASIEPDAAELFEAGHAYLFARVDGALEREWLQQLKQRAFVLPSKMRVPIGMCRAIPDFLYEDSGVAIYVDGGDAARELRDLGLDAMLEDDGYTVLRFGERSQWDALFDEWQDLFRRNL